jgi:16S rRNA (guanine527-N7)-methyltransferase
MKIARPELELTMIESKSRKAAFLREVTRTLDLHGATVLNARFEEVHDRDGQVDVVTVRAVRSDATLESAAARLLRDDGWLLAFRATAEQETPGGFRHVATAALTKEKPSWLHVYARMFHVEQP